MSITLLKFKDNTYTWLAENHNPEFPCSESEIIASGHWMLKIPVNEIKMAIKTMKMKGDDKALFGDMQKIFMYSDKRKG